jgi:hypothetical protein
MPNPIFENQPQPGDQGIFGLVKQLKGGGAEQMFNQMYQTNPQFRDFANSMKGKTPQQAFQERGFDFGPFRDMMK